MSVAAPQPRNISSCKKFTSPFVSPEYTSTTFPKFPKAHWEPRGLTGRTLVMPLNKHLVELSDKYLIACRECHAIGDVSMIGSRVKLICPKCHRTLGCWETVVAASADLTAFIAGRSQQRTDQ